MFDLRRNIERQRCWRKRSAMRIARGGEASQTSGRGQVSAISIVRRALMHRAAGMFRCLPTKKNHRCVTALTEIRSNCAKSKSKNLISLPVLQLA